MAFTYLLILYMLLSNRYILNNKALQKHKFSYSLNSNWWENRVINPYLIQNKKNMDWPPSRTSTTIAYIDHDQLRTSSTIASLLFSVGNDNLRWDYTCIASRASWLKRLGQGLSKRETGRHGFWVWSQALLKYKRENFHSIRVSQRPWSVLFFWIFYRRTNAILGGLKSHSFSWWFLIVGMKFLIHLNFLGLWFNSNCACFDSWKGERACNFCVHVNRLYLSLSSFLFIWIYFLLLFNFE